jgi:CDP-4-dehydro-6-deoxyglucose reductase
MPVISLSTGNTFKAEPGVTILDAATSARIALPYSCKTGRCSTCKSKVLTGKTSALCPETGLTEDERKEGWVLGCVRLAETDVTLEVEDLVGVEMPAVKTLPSRISQINRLAPDVIQVLLRLPPTADFNFIPGQYVDVIGRDGARRSYSLACASSDDKAIELHIRAVEGGVMSRYWFEQAQVNDLLRLNGPFGTFFLRETANIDLFFLATGTGIAPIKAILNSMANLRDDQRPKSVTILWGGRATQDLYFDVEGAFNKCQYIPVLSRPDDQWSGAKGYVQDVLLGLNPDLTSAAVYACGSDAMIASAKTRLVEAGLSTKRFYSDAFVCSGTN